MLENSLQKLVPFFVKFSNLKVIRTLKNGFIRTVPFTLIGSIFLLIMYFPINGYNEFMSGIFGENWLEPLGKVVSGTYDILAILAAFALAYEYCKDEGLDGVPAGLFAISGLIIFSPNSAATVSGEVLGGILPLAWIGGKGLIAAVIAGFISGSLYTWFIKRNISIKLPDTVPPAVANSFAALIPGTVILITYALLHIIAGAIADGTVTETIYYWLQIPLQNLTDSLPGVIIMAFGVSLFWWCGVHGDAIITSGILAPILNSNLLANKAIIDSGEALIVGENAKILTEQFTLFIKMGGAGATMGLIISMVLFGKSQQMRQLGKLGLGPALFNINEPLIFGTPIIFNPILFIPFILAPTINAIIGYFAISTGLIVPFGGVTVPWTLPAIISGLFVGGWKVALLQAGLIVLDILIYLPFFRVHDKLLLKKELEMEVDLNA